MTVVAAARPENRRAALLLERLQVRHKRPKLVVWDDPAPVRRADDRGIQESSGIDLSGDWGLGTPPSSFGPWQLMPLPGGAQTKVRGPLVAQTSIGRLAQPCGAEPTRSRKYLQTTLFRGVRRRASLCPTRPVTPEVAGSSPVAPVKSLQIAYVFDISTAGFFFIPRRSRARSDLKSPQGAAPSR